MGFLCRVCGMGFPAHHNGAFEAHVMRCVERHADLIDGLRHPGAPFEGDPELAAFARAEGDVWNRRAGTRRRAR
jgi:hypothetical protein